MKIKRINHIVFYYLGGPEVTCKWSIIIITIILRGGLDICLKCRTVSKTRVRSTFIAISWNKDILLFLLITTKKKKKKHISYL